MYRLETATKLAQNMICRYGMSEEFGVAAVSDDLSLNTAIFEKITEIVNRILGSQLEEACRVLEENRETLDAFVDLLIEKNHLGYSEIENFFSERMF